MKTKSGTKQKTEITNMETAEKIGTGEVKSDRMHIENEEQANWVLWRLATIRSERERVKAQTEKKMSELKADEDGLLHLYESELEVFARGEIEAKGSRRKSFHLMQGTLAFRTVPAGMVVSDERAAFEAAKNDDRLFLARRTILDSAKYRQLAEEAYRETGELLPGMDTVPARESFTIKFGKTEKE